MAGKKKDMKGGVEDTKILRMLKELDELYELLTKPDQGMFNKLRFGSRLENFFEILKNILRNHFLSSVYINIDERVQKLLELWGKFTKIKEIKNSGLSEIVKLFQANIIYIADEVKSKLLEILQNINRKIVNTKNGRNYKGIEINLLELDAIEKYIDYFILFIQLLSSTFSNNSNKNLNSLKESFKIVLQQYLLYIHQLSEHVMQLNDDDPLKQKYLQIFRKRNFQNGNTNENRIKKFMPEKKSINLTQRNVSNTYYSTNIKETRQIPYSVDMKNRQKNEDYNRILRELQTEYRYNANKSDLPKLVTVSSILSRFLSLKRIPEGNNKEILKRAIQQTIAQKSHILKNYGEIFRKYEDFPMHLIQPSQ